ncbi:MAG TPA: YdhR family protein [Acidothermaceae bacterium]
MVGTFVTFNYGNDFDRARVESVAEHARQNFGGMPGLHSKVFTVDENNRRAINVYVWDSAEAAHAFFSEQMVERVTGLYGVRPVVDIVDIAAIVENAISV